MNLIAIFSVFFCVFDGAAPSVAVVNTNPYCNISTCAYYQPGGVKSNTLCLYSNTSYGEWCAPNYYVTVNKADIDTILTVSNNYRSKVALGKELRGNPGPQPKATNMHQLYWDAELANMAQTHAQRCVFAHDICRDVSRFQVGQNLYVSFSTAKFKNANWTAAIESWYDEVKDITPAAFKSTPQSFPAMIGHYTQLVGGNTHLVGCGIASYKDSTNFNKKYPFKILYVCNYGPAGNFIGQPVYGSGTTTGSACPKRTKLNKETGLCAKHSS